MKVQESLANLTGANGGCVQARQDQQVAEALAREHQQAAASLSTAQQELGLMQQRLEVAEKQIEVLRAQLGHAAAEKASVAAERRRLQASGWRGGKEGSRPLQSLLCGCSRDHGGSCIAY